MTVNKRRKFSRQRGSWTHGWGEKKKHRGAGSRGGRGLGGSGKRGDAKKPSLWKDPHYFGKKGFVKKGVSVDIRAINIKDLEARFEKYEKDKKINKEGDSYKIVLEDLGYNKLLGTGEPSRKYHITVPYASKSAVERIKNAGGDVVLQ